MSDLIKRINVLLEYYQNCPTGSNYTVLSECKAALEAKGEAVAWLDLKKLSVSGMAYATSRNANSRQVPLYTAPPSVDALEEELRVTEQNLADCMARLHAYDCKIESLIAEIDGLRRYGDHDSLYGFDLDPVLNKYRSTK